MKTENSKTRMRPAQTGSKNSNLDFPLCLCDSVVKRLLPAQRYSGNSILGTGEQVIMTVLVKNLEGCFMGGWEKWSMSKMQNVFPQQHSKMSNLKIETENSLPQRHSKMSNRRLSGVLWWAHGRNEMLTMQVKKAGALVYDKKRQLPFETCRRKFVFLSERGFSTKRCYIKSLLKNKGCCL